LKKSLQAIRGGGLGALAIGAIITGALSASSAVASATASPGDQDAVGYATEMNAASRIDGLPDDTTPYQARNGAIVICAQRRGNFSERELITQFGGNASAAVIVTRAEYHFCPEYR
jgi:hypothetical protein